ncbi:MAG: tetratricopeptide repeat protein [Bacteroidetes bacterium]|nr:tetratricopeptide repeat protein [Bacteroidota bacterium]
MKLVIIFLLFMNMICHGQQNKITYPSYENVINNFFEKYSVKDLPGRYGITDELKFEKKSDGWHVVVCDAMNNNVFKDELFWSTESASFLKINFESAADTKENKTNRYAFDDNWKIHNFNICPYYGYIGWDWDVIEDFKNSNNLSDSVLFGLGRAYSSYASNLLNNNTGYALKKNQFVLPNTRNCMSPQQLETYREYRHAAINIYKNCSKEIHRFETIVGEMAIKYSNENLVSFLDLKIYQNEEEARKELKSGLYTPFYINAAKNYLNSCEPNAILFTNGDNDTYPLLYVQAMYGFRTDVLVVNLSLLNTERYINYMRHPYAGAVPLSFSFTEQELENKNLEYALFAKNEESEISLSDVLKKLHEVNNDQATTEKIKKISSRNFTFHTDAFLLDWKYSKSYLSLSDILVLDIIHSHMGKRPIYFAGTIGGENFLGLKNYLSLEGIVYKLSTQKFENSDYYTGGINTNTLFNIVINNFEWAGMNTTSKSKTLICKTLRLTFYRLAYELIKENKLDSARHVLNMCFETMPDNYEPFDLITLNLIECLYALHDTTKAVEISRLLLQSAINGRFDEVKSTSSSSTDYKQAIMGGLRKLAYNNNQTSFATELDQIIYYWH